MGHSNECEAHKYVGLSYPYYSRLVPIGTMSYGLGVFFSLRSLRPEIVHACDFEGLLGVAAYKRLVNPAVTVVYDIADTYSERYQVAEGVANCIQWIDDQLTRSANVVVVPQENRCGHLDWCSERLVVIQNTPYHADAPIYVTPPRRDELRVLISGQMMWSRGIRELVNAAILNGRVRIIAVAEKYPAGVREFLMQSGVVQIEAGRSQAELLQLAATCDLLAALYEPSTAINRKAAPNKVFDAMAVGRPIVVNSEVEVSTRVTDLWRCGYACPYHDPKAISEVFEVILSNPADAIARGRRGRDIFETQLNWESVSLRLGERLEHFVEAFAHLNRFEGSHRGEG